jgi:F0F1-type ATP synthase assembly protein I
LFRKLAAACIVAAGFGFVAWVFVAGLTDKSVAERDFISYWTAGQQLAHGLNPYDFGAIRELERIAGRPDSQSLLVMRNPPVAFLLAWPLGFFDLKTAFKLWVLILLAGLSLAPWMIWRLNGRPDSRLHLLGYGFAPAIACLKAGQFGIFLLAGVTLFLCFHRSRPFLAGTALLLCAMKPHLFFPFAVVLLLWSVTRNTYRILAGFSIALLASCALSFCLDSHAWSQYSQMMHAGGALDEAVPVLSVFFRFLIDRKAVWLQFLPCAAACVWALWYFWTRRSLWNWMDQGLVLLLVSAMCTPFGWFTDESMLLPAVLIGLDRAAGSRRVFVLFGLICGISLIEVFANVRLTSPFYLWTTPAWLGWYLFATRKKEITAERIGPEIAAAESQ